MRYAKKLTKSEKLIEGLREIKNNSSINYEAYMIKASFGVYSVTYGAQHGVLNVVDIENNKQKDPKGFSIYNLGDEFVLENNRTGKTYRLEYLAVGAFTFNEDGSTSTNTYVVGGVVL